jgi:hypothetical protein
LGEAAKIMEFEKWGKDSMAFSRKLDKQSNAWTIAPSPLPLFQTSGEEFGRRNQDEAYLHRHFENVAAMSMLL